MGKHVFLVFVYWVSVYVVVVMDEGRKTQRDEIRKDLIMPLLKLRTLCLYLDSLATVWNMNGVHKGRLRKRVLQFKQLLIVT